MNKNNRWENYTENNKARAIYAFLRSRNAGVWHVLGKTRQNFWKHVYYEVKHTTKDYDKMRNELFNEFISELEKSGCKAKLTKLFTALEYLGTKSDWEKIDRKEYKL